MTISKHSIWTVVLAIDLPPFEDTTESDYNDRRPGGLLERSPVRESRVRHCVDKDGPSSVHLGNGTVLQLESSNLVNTTSSLDPMALVLPLLQ